MEESLLILVNKGHDWTGCDAAQFERLLQRLCERGVGVARHGTCVLVSWPDFLGGPLQLAHRSRTLSLRFYRDDHRKAFDTAKIASNVIRLLAVMRELGIG